MPSSVISAMFYDEFRKTLTIVYQGNRGVYRYHNVTPLEYAAFRAAPSKGTYLNHVFKKKHHTFERLHSTQVIHLVKKASHTTSESSTHGEDHRRGHH